MLSHLLKRQPAKVNGPQCSEKCRERKIVFCDWGFHGRSANDGWEFTLVDEVDLDPEENLDEYPQLPPSECADTISKFAKSQLKKNCRLKSSKGWYVNHIGLGEMFMVLTCRPGSFLVSLKTESTEKSQSEGEIEHQGRCCSLREKCRVPVMARIATKNASNIADR